MTRIWNLIVGVTGIAAGALVVSCSRDSPPMSYSAAPISGPQPIDGTYGGMMQLIRGDTMTCGNTDEFRLQVVDQSFTYRLLQPQADWQPVLVFTTAIAPDGNFTATSGNGFMRGTLKDGHMRGRISGDTCGFTFDADRSGTW